MKAVARSNSWWPGVNQALEDQVRNCLPCLANRHNPAPAPLWVMVRNYRGRVAWLPGVVVHNLGPLTYSVQVGSEALWWCHIDHLRPAGNLTWPELSDSDHFLNLSTTESPHLKTMAPSIVQEQQPDQLPSSETENTPWYPSQDRNPSDRYSPSAHWQLYYAFFWFWVVVVLVFGSVLLRGRCVVSVIMCACIMWSIPCLMSEIAFPLAVRLCLLLLL